MGSLECVRPFNEVAFPTLPPLFALSSGGNTDLLRYAICTVEGHSTSIAMATTHTAHGNSTVERGQKPETGFEEIVVSIYHLP